MSFQTLTPPSANQQTVKWMTATAARTAGDIVFIDMTDAGFVDLTIPDNAAVHRAAVALSNIASGAVGPYCVEGECVMTVPAAAYTAGHGLIVNNGAVATSGAAFPAAGAAGEAQVAFAVIKTGGAAGTTSITGVMLGDSFTSTT